ERQEGRGHDSVGPNAVWFGRRKAISGDLLDDESVVRQVVVERADHPIAVAPGFVEVVGIADQIEPVAAPPLAVPRRGEETIDDLGESLGGWIRQERVDLL